MRAALILVPALLTLAACADFNRPVGTAEVAQGFGQATVNNISVQAAALPHQSMNGRYAQVVMDNYADPTGEDSLAEREHPQNVVVATETKPGA